MDPLTEAPRTDPLALARPLALAFAAALAVASTAAWGTAGGASALLGAAISLVNVWGLHRIARRAAGQALELGPGPATGALTAALGAKTVALFVLVALVTRVLPVVVTPFALGLLVTVFALVAGGLMAARQTPQDR
jgi:hypothetical protein